MSLNATAPRRWKRLRAGGRLFRSVRPWTDPKTGVAGIRTTYGRSRNAVDKHGERVTAVRLDGSPFVNLSHRRGNDARTEFIEWHRGTYDMDDMDVEAWALERLTTREPVVAWCGRCGRPMQGGDLMCCPGESD